MVSLVTWEIGAFDVSRDRDSRDRHESIQLWGTSTQNSKFLICVQCYSLLWPEGNFLDKCANKACLQSTAYVAQIDNIFKFTVNHKFPRPSDPDVMLKTVLVSNMMLYFVAWQCALLNHAASEYLHCHALTRQDVVSPGCTHHCLSENPTWEYLNRIRYPTISNMPGKVGDVMWYQSAFRTWHSLSLFCNSSISNCSFGGQSLLGPQSASCLWFWRTHDPLNSSQSDKGAFSRNWVIICPSAAPCSIQPASCRLQSLDIRNKDFAARKKKTVKYIYIYNITLQNLAKGHSSHVSPCEPLLSSSFVAVPQLFTQIPCFSHSQSRFACSTILQAKASKGLRIWSSNLWLSRLKLLGFCNPLQGLSRLIKPFHLANSQWVWLWKWNRMKRKGHVRTQHRSEVPED